MALLGLDVGTSGSRALMLDDDGRVLDSATADHAAFTAARIGWAEQAPEDWWRASVSALRSVLASRAGAPHAVRAVGLSGQMHGAVLLDARDCVVRPALIWCDQRTDAECRWLDERLGRARLIELTCNPPLTGFTLPKLLWVRRHEPRAWDRVRHVLLPKDFVRLRLTGDKATDAADASGTLLFDVARRRWSSAVAAAAELDERLLPRVFEGPEITGTVSAQAAAVTGLPAGTPVVAGGGDQAAGAVGMGVVRPGTVSATIGTSGVVFAATDGPALDARGRVHTFCHAAPSRWHVMGVTQAAGLSLRWFAQQLGGGLAEPADTADLVQRQPYDRLCAEAASVPPGSEGVLWAPYLQGERTPHLDTEARAALIGLSVSHTRAHAVRAILEGVAFSLKDSFAILEAMQVPIGAVRLGGGGARSPLWCQIQADVYDREVETLAAEEGAAFGAALLAGVGAGLWPTIDEACAQAVSVARRFAPNPESARVMAAGYERFRAVYPALKRI